MRTQSLLLPLTLLIKTNAHVLNVRDESAAAHVAHAPGPSVAIVSPPVLFGVSASAPAPTLPQTPAPARVVAPTVQLKDDPSCLILGEALAICASLTFNFRDIDLTAQAECLCYSSTAWAPAIFDSAVQSCATFASISATSAYPALAKIQGFCRTIGNVLKSPATNNFITMTAPPTIPACVAMNSIVASCNSLTPGLSTMDEAIQAECLCNPTLGIWAPTVFDNAVDACSHDATADSASFAPATALKGFCSRIGNGANRVSTSTAATPTNSGAASSTMPLAAPTDSTTISEISVLPIPAPGSVPATPVTPSTTAMATTSVLSTTSHNTLAPPHGMETVTPSAPISIPTGQAVLANAPNAEVIIISLVCATLMLFLC